MSSTRPSRTSSLLHRYSREYERLTEQGLAGLAFDRGQAMAKLHAQLHAIVDQSFDGILAFDDRGRLLMANPAAARMFKREAEAMAGLRIGQMFADPVPEPTHGPGTPEDTGDRCEAEAMRADGSTFPAELSLSTISVEGRPQRLVTVRDTSHRRAHERRLRHQATHDPLTNLGNRVLLQEALETELQRIAGDSTSLALLLIDLDRFKEVNDTLGHAFGDLLLIEVAKRISAVVRTGDLVARLGGDEFAVLLRADTGLADALEIARRIVEAIQRQFVLGESGLTEVDLSLGVALAPQHTRDAIELVRCADVSMYAAKRGSGPIEVYDQQRDPHNIRRLVATTAVRGAIARHELSLAYQPKVSLRTGQICGVEALIRWDHPEHGPISPHEFIPVAEQTGSIVPMTHWILTEAIRQLAAWRADGLELGVAVNIAARSLHDEELPAFIAGLIAETGVPAQRITLELTETSVIADSVSVTKVLQGLRDLGLRLSIDDFGTGYSSLALLQRLRVHELKIDASFIAAMGSDPQNAILVRSAVELAHNLGLEAVAEGVETEESLLQLRQIGCDIVQGYLTGRATRPERLTKLLMTQRDRRSRAA